MNNVTVSSSPVKVTLRYGQKGERGIGISSVALDDKAHLIITYDDGKTQDAGAALGDVTSIKDGIDSTYKKIQASEANVTKLEASTKTNAEKAQQALQDTHSASTSGVNTINTLVTEKMTYMTSTFNSLLTQAKANIDQWERDAEDKIHKVRTYSLEQIKTAHDDAMVDIERSVNKTEAWAVSETTPDREPDFESPTGLTQSSRSWALYSKKKAQEATDALKGIKDLENGFTTASLTVLGETSVPTPSTENNSKTIANTEFVHGVVSDLVNGAPTALDTLQELATALGNDPNFATTILNKIGELDDTVGVEKPTVIKLVTGGFRLTDGLVYTTNKTLQTEKLIHLSVGDIVASSNINMQYAWRRYSDSEEKNFIDATLNGFGSHEYVADKDAWYKFMFRYKDNTDADLTDKIDSMQKELRIIYETQNSTLPRKISDLEKNVANLKDVTDKDMDTLLQKNYHDKVKTSEVSVSNMDAYGLNPDMTTIDNSNLRRFVLTDVSEGDIITVSSVMEKNGVKQRLTVNINAVVAFYDDALLVSKGKWYNIKAPSFQIPSKINKVIITCSPILSYPNVAITITKPNAVVERIVKQKKQGKPFIYKGAMNKGDVISLGFENAWTNKIWMFTGLLSSAFKSTKIGAYNNGEIVRPYIEITPTHVNVYSSISRFDSTFEHGLTIEKDFQVIVEQGRSLYNKRLIIQSNGKRWVCPNATNLRVGEPTDGIGASTDNDYSLCTFSVSMLDMNKPVWVFGDSWVSLYDNRWVGQAVSLGYDKGFLLDGYAGRTSQTALKSLKSLIAVQQPKIIVWLMGMNDEDPNDDTPNQNWLDALKEVESICKQYNITLVLYTIPSVPESQEDYTGYGRNNNAKNTYVKMSGYRYVDAVTALGVDENRNWISGYWQSSNNHAHTSEEGARALMVQMFADVPEMLYF